VERQAQVERPAQVDGMSGGAAAMNRLAAVARGAADDTRGVATRVARQHDVPWRSSAADGYRDRLAHLSAQVRAVAGEVDRVAADLQRLAGRLS
jgi:hypothetical protein